MGDVVSDYIENGRPKAYAADERTGFEMLLVKPQI